MKEFELLRLADLNLIEFWRESSKWIPNTEIFETQETVFINSGIDFPGCSLVFNLSKDAIEQPAEFITRSKAFFSGRKRGFSLLLRGHCDQNIIQYCKDQKIFLVGEQPGMVLDRKAKGGEAPAGAELRWVNNATELQDFREVAAEAFMDLAFPREVSESYFTYAERVLSPFSILATIYFDGEASCCAMALLSHGIAGVYGWARPGKPGARDWLNTVCRKSATLQSTWAHGRSSSRQASSEPRYIRR